MDNREVYLKGVCGEVRFWAARKYIKRELSAHIDDKKAELQAGGITDAEAGAVKAMGDPAETGRALNAIHRPRVEWGVISCVLLLSAAGFIAQQACFLNGMIDTSLSMMFNRVDWEPMIAGLAVMTVLMFADYSWLIWLRHACFGVALACIAVYTWLTYTYTYYWFLPGWSGQVAAIVIPATLFLLGMAGFIQRHNRWRVWDMVLLLGLAAVSLIAMSHVSVPYTLLLAVAELVMLLTALAWGPLNPVQKAWRAANCAAMFVLILALLHVLQAVSYSISNDFDLDSVRHMLSGAPLVGLSPAYMADGIWNLSDGSTDNILAASIGAYGWLFGIGVIVLFGALLALLIARSLRVAHSFGRLLALGVCAYFGIRFALFTLSNLGLLGSLSLNLPFFGRGSFNYFTDALFTGLFLSVWRRSSFMPRDAVPGAAVPVAPAPPIQ